MFQTSLDYFSSQQAALRGALTEGSGLMFAYLEALLSAEFGLTDLEASLQLGVKQTTAGARRADLRRKFPEQQGFVVDSGERRYGDSGKLIIVWSARKDLLAIYRRDFGVDHRIDGSLDGVNV